MRGLFTQTVALRLCSRDEVATVLGDGLADAAAAHRIDPNEPGTGYVIDEDGSTVRVRADYWFDSLIRSVASEYGLATQRVAGSGGELRTSAWQLSASAPRPPLPQPFRSY